eukprot:1721935-Amphidinium_carterae.1
MQNPPEIRPFSRSGYTFYIGLAQVKVYIYHKSGYASTSAWHRVLRLEALSVSGLEVARVLGLKNP